jgi:hypothetical protein
MTTGHYVRSMKQLADQWSPTNYRDERRQRLYLKDIDCPDEWREALQKVIHPGLWYLNEDASRHEKSDSDQVFGHENSAAPAGDLMSSLPEPMRAQNLMCYIGHEGTYTPAHREMCASLGQNIMVETSKDGNGEKAGSSIWFMTESKDREVVREYFLSMLGHDIEIEKHFAQINAWKKAPFDVYIVDQREGDFILIPPLAAHQVWNRGTRTMKVAWNRTTPETLEMAIHEALPKARLVCRDEQYKNKAILYFTLSKYYRDLQALEEDAELTQMSFIGLGQDIIRNSPRARRLAEDFKKLLGLFTEILVDEMFAHKEQDVEYIEFDSCVTCSYCRSNIFNRFLTCKHCVRTLVTGDEDAYDICMECYAIGRSCLCLSRLKWCEQWSWSELVDNYEAWRAMVIKNDGYVDFETSPQPLEIARQRSRKKTVAQICQEGLQRRPFKDITKPEEQKRDEPSESEPDAGAEKAQKKKPKRKQKKGELRRCHVCCHKDYSYRVHMCTNPGCQEGYCYGVLYRAFDMLPQKVQEDEQWQCPKCQGICNCGACRRSGNTNAYTPKNTLLGHDTRALADDRSVEALVDFRIHNLSWLKATGEESRSNDSKRIQRLKAQADNARAQDITTHGDEPAESERDYHQGGHAPLAELGAETQNGDHQAHVVLDDDEGMQHLRNAIMADSHDTMPEGHAAPVLNEEESASSYPDPALLARQRIGMGYYEQDDTPDKILLDPYQAPTAEAMRPEEPEVPDFVKKSLRAAKRKARRENDDDPDFVVSKSYSKKARTRPAADDFLANMDPALFAGQPTVPGAVMDADEGPSVLAEDQVTNTEDQNTDGQPVQRTHAPRYEPNEPALRHAKPKISYVEPEDIEMTENDQVQRPRSPVHTGGGTEPQTAIDLAADAVRKMIEKQSGQPALKDGVAPKRRGRPPKRRGRPPKRLSAPAVDFEVGAEDEAEPTPAKTTPASKPRQTRTSLAAAASLSDEEAHGESEKAEEHRSARHSRRARRSGVTTISAATAELQDEDFEEGTPAPPAQGAPASGQRKRGRPRKSEAAPAPSSSSGTQFLSMAERMALKGKKFKIAKRKSQPSSAVDDGKSTIDASSQLQLENEASKKASTPDAEGSLSASEDVNEAASKSSSRARVAASLPSKRPAASSVMTAPSGRTVVKLADGEDESDASMAFLESSSEESSDDGDDDIPAGGPAVSSRGRGNLARGRGRGRGRGRPRGSSRADF